MPSIDDMDRDEAAEKILEVLRSALDRDIISKDQVLRAIKPKGRAAPELPEFTFPGSGITVKVRRLGPFTLDMMSRQARAEDPPPPVPTRMVNYGTEDEPVWEREENPADPEYRKLLEEYENKIEESGGRQVIDTIIKNAVIADIDYEEVDYMRSFLLELGSPKEEVDAMSDHMVYVKHICIKNGDDLTKLQKFVIGESVPTEERVQAHEDAFRGQVSGQANQTVQDSDVRDKTQHIPGLGNGNSVVEPIYERRIR